MTDADTQPLRTRAWSGRQRGIVVVAVLLTAASLLRLLTLDDAEAVLDDVRSWGAWPWLVIVLLLWADLVLPVPQPSVIALAGVLYGVAAGALLGTVGLVLGGASGYWLARSPLRRLMLRLLRTADPERLAVISEYAGPWGIALTRSLPYSVPEAVVIVAGLGRVPWKTVLAALVAGSAPVALLYAGIGAGWSGEPVLALVISQVVPVAALPIALRRSTPSQARRDSARADGRPNGAMPLRRDFKRDRRIPNGGRPR
jgi:uncharacterized membrane protein YdjX (TVP38/TMEM64 family)